MKNKLLISAIVVGAAFCNSANAQTNSTGTEATGKTQQATVVLEGHTFPMSASDYMAAKQALRAKQAAQPTMNTNKVVIPANSPENVNSVVTNRPAVNNQQLTVEPGSKNFMVVPATEEQKTSAVTQTSVVKNEPATGKTESSIIRPLVQSPAASAAPVKDGPATSTETKIPVLPATQEVTPEKPKSN